MAPVLTRRLSSSQFIILLVENDYEAVTFSRSPCVFPCPRREVSAYIIQKVCQGIIRGK